MGTSTITPASVEPISLLEAHAHCRVATDDEDPILLTYMLAARQMAEAIIHQVCITQTVDCTFDYHWPWVKIAHEFYYARPRLYLPVSPVQSVTSVKYLDGNGALQVLDPSQYIVVLDGPVPYIEPAYGVTFPTVRWQPQAITVRVVAGYGDDPTDTPQPIRAAMLLLVAHLYANREAVQVTTRSGAPNAGDEMPLGVEALLSPYRLTRIL